MAVIVAVGVLPSLAVAEDQTPDQLRADAAKLITKAQDLKADGHGEEANRLVNQAEELQQAAGKLEKQQGLKRSETNDDSHPAKSEADELRARAKELEAAGKTDEANMVNRRLGEIDQRAAPDRKQRSWLPRRKTSKRTATAKRPTGWSIKLRNCSKSPQRLKSSKVSRIRTHARTLTKPKAKWRSCAPGRKNLRPREKQTKPEWSNAASVKSNRVQIRIGCNASLRKPEHRENSAETNPR